VNKKALAGILGALVVCLVVSLSGCETSTNKASSVDSRLVGTWQGSVALSSFSGRGNSTLIQITFTGSKAVLTTESDFGTRTMNATYQISGGSLVLEPQFTRDFGGRQPFNGTIPTNGTGPSGNGTGPYNGTRPNWNDSNRSWPRNGTWLGNETQLPGSRPQSTMTFTYRFNEGDTVLYLDNAVFTKVS